MTLGRRRGLAATWSGAAAANSVNLSFRLMPVAWRPCTFSITILPLGVKLTKALSEPNTTLETNVRPQVTWNMKYHIPKSQQKVSNNRKTKFSEKADTRNSANLARVHFFFCGIFWTVNIVFFPEQRKNCYKYLQ